MMQDKRDILVYVFGPYRSENAYGIFENIMQARQTAAEIWRLGYTAVCPHLNSFLLDGVCEDADFLEGCLEIMKRCDALCAASPLWFQSEGSRMEVDLASRLDLPIVFSPDELNRIFRHV